MSDTTTMTEQEILDQIQSEVAANKVFLYMKGVPEMPRCGFSNQVVPTIPQLFVDGELVGGCDIVTEMFQEGELQPLVGAGAQATS